MEPTQQHHSEEPEFVFDPEEHQVVSLDEALEIFGDDGAVPEAAQESDDEDDDEERLWPDNAVAHLASHTGSLFSISVHPRDPLLAVSGGEDDLAYLWKIDTGEEIAKLSGHSDSVSAVAFSFDGELVASGGMDGKVRMWRRVKDVPGGTWQWARWEFLTSLDGPDEVTVRCCQSKALEYDHNHSPFIQTLLWHPKGNVLLAGSADGTIWMWNCKGPLTFASNTNYV